MEKRGQHETGGQERNRKGVLTPGPLRVGPQASRVGQGSQRDTSTRHLTPAALATGPT